MGRGRAKKQTTTTLAEPTTKVGSTVSPIGQGCGGHLTPQNQMSLNVQSLTKEHTEEKRMQSKGESQVIANPNNAHKQTAMNTMDTMVTELENPTLTTSATIAMAGEGQQKMNSTQETQQVGITEGKNGQTWANVVAGNPFATRGMNLNYYAPVYKDGKCVVALEQEDIEEECVKWQKSLILYVIGESPTFGAVERFLKSLGICRERPHMYYHNDNYFIIRFQTLEERDQVLLSGPSTINNKPVIMKPWTSTFSFKEEVLKNVPIWVKFPNLPVECWGMKVLSKISNGLGTPIYADDCTTHITRISYARVLIEMDITKPLPKTMPVKTPNGDLFDQMIAYDWEPQYCQKCLQIGHDCHTNPRPAKQPITQPQPNTIKPQATYNQRGGKNVQHWRNKGNEHHLGRVTANITQGPNKEGWAEGNNKAATRSPAKTRRDGKGLSTENGFQALTDHELVGLDVLTHIGKRSEQGKSRKGDENYNNAFPPIQK
ncbi:uncharacterized protein LOC132628505 [Lycium barbarum]|uniref:uncharacterized protein LOC132628505 n=1 Tax=Lycium barbarum TaxID=112863 RepID=UPI00293E5AB2|nr:uncharacterized protein LOC132628505 [Lycium barbarum]